MTQPVCSVVVVGGGTAGWLAASIIAARHARHTSRENGTTVTVIESPDIPTIGVGEGTWPTMRDTLQNIGISETDFFRRCNASFKQGGKFIGWTSGAVTDFYYHPFRVPVGHQQLTLAPYWHEQLRGKGTKFADAVDYQHALCERGLAPKSISAPEYSGVANYAYHLDAGEFVKLLRDHATGKLGVQHILDSVSGSTQDECGNITHLSLGSGASLAGDLFVDCTGFRSLLLGSTLKVPFSPANETLFADNALAIQVPYEDQLQEIPSQTLATAQSAGWIWDISLSNRRGIGHVYSSSHIGHDEAEHELRSYIGPLADDLPVRRIAINAGRRARFWEKNVVAIGLSAGFLEPLEASALLLVELSSNFVSEQMPVCREAMPAVAKRFNSLSSYRWDRIVDFLKLHYALTKRSDTDFWIDNARPESIPDGLREKLEYWRFQPPSSYDFDSSGEIFGWSSYHYVMYGMGFEFDATALPLLTSQKELAAQLFQANEAQKRMVLTDLPSNREILTKLQKYAFQAV